MGYRTFVNGEILTDSNIMTYLMKQSVIVCTSGTRPSSPPEGMFIYETDTKRYAAYTGTAWVTVLELTPTWTAITGWSANISADGTSVPQYHVGPNGRVDLRGRVNHSTTFVGSGATIVTLPSGAWPNVDRHFPVARNFATANTSDARITISSAGVVTLYCPASETTWFSLDGVYFHTS